LPRDEYETLLTKPTQIADSIQFERPVQFGNKAVLRRCAVQSPESAMKEAEYEQLLHAISDVIALVPEEEPMATLIYRPMRQPKTANDNQLAWPLIPFPQGWHAAC
jgi:hypothetical protein